ncbi:hypothetical protein PoB_000787100 [Plakobranchus ocellatus]|uniref:Uncharacterized protein n=1 Tax=Plakobranchus ocellatus TaxID=259542 RepID=A0AAV3Y2D0_9GAST|nr:hypothetical protein PoB_000787100 [Plakobranchus ocellatus]
MADDMLHVQESIDCRSTWDYIPRRLMAYGDEIVYFFFIVTFDGVVVDDDDDDDVVAAVDAVAFFVSRISNNFIPNVHFYINRILKLNCSIYTEIGTIDVLVQ